MADIHGFMKYDRKENQKISPIKRVVDFSEFTLYLEPEQRKMQAARCMNCGVPYCSSSMELKGMVTGCPLNNLISEFNDELYKGHGYEALERLLKQNPFPEFTGRVCPALCEKACLNGYDGQPVTIHDNELYIIENGFEKGWVQANPPKVRTDKKIAVIGSGPAGLSVAYMLNQRGHQVSVYERDKEPGGLLMYGIPNMKLDKSIIRRRIELMKQEGIQFYTNCDIGNNIEFKNLYKDHDAIIVCCGAKQARKLNLENEDIEGIYPAVDFLSEITDMIETNKRPISLEGKNVVIVGGGDTGNDCVATSIRLHCKTVTQLEMMPKPAMTRRLDNPWPEWPKVLKTDYGQQESIELFHKDPRIYQTTIKEIKKKGNHITHVVTTKLQFDGKKMVQIPGSETELKCDLLLIAAGFTGVESYVQDALHIKMSKRNTFEANNHQTNDDKVFVAGDCRRGQSLVVWAIHEGIECARKVDEYLMGYSNIE